jgi:hypothetical protein
MYLLYRHLKKKKQQKKEQKALEQADYDNNAASAASESGPISRPPDAFAQSDPPASNMQQQDVDTN